MCSSHEHPPQGDGAPHGQKSHHPLCEPCHLAGEEAVRDHPHQEEVGPGGSGLGAVVRGTGGAWHPLQGALAGGGPETPFSSHLGCPGAQPGISGDVCVCRGQPCTPGAELERSVRLEGLGHQGRNIQKGFWGGRELLEVILRQGAEKWVEIPD